MTCFTRIHIPVSLSALPVGAECLFTNLYNLRTFYHATKLAVQAKNPNNIKLEIHLLCGYGVPGGGAIYNCLAEPTPPKKMYVEFSGGIKVSWIQNPESLLNPNAPILSKEKQRQLL